jgi:hypothetical protein
MWIARTIDSTYFAAVAVVFDVQSWVVTVATAILKVPPVFVQRLSTQQQTQLRARRAPVWTLVGGAHGFGGTGSSLSTGRQSAWNRAVQPFIGAEPTTIGGHTAP